MAVDRLDHERPLGAIAMPAVAQARGGSDELVAWPVVLLKRPLE